MVTHVGLVGTSVIMAEAPALTCAGTTAGPASSPMSSFSGVDKVARLPASTAVPRVLRAPTPAAPDCGPVAALAELLAVAEVPVLAAVDLSPDAAAELVVVAELATELVAE